MAEASRTLRDELIKNYQGLVKRLAQKLDSSDDAREALHDTFLRLREIPPPTEVMKPTEFIFRIAVNIARDHQKARNRRAGDPDGLFGVTDETPGPQRITEARSDVVALKEALAQLPPRARQTLYSIAIDELTGEETATLLGVSLRTVERDLKFAVAHCARRVGHRSIRRRGPRPGRDQRS